MQDPPGQLDCTDLGSVKMLVCSISKPIAPTEEAAAEDFRAGRNCVSITFQVEEDERLKSRCMTIWMLGYDCANCNSDRIQGSWVPVKLNAPPTPVLSPTVNSTVEG
jgi:hypothetical protein